MPGIDQQRREQDDQAKENEKNRNEAAEQHRIQYTFRDVTSTARYQLGISRSVGGRGRPFGRGRVRIAGRGCP